MHTTASDGKLTPAELVARAAAAGLTTISVTDHDTVAALDEVTAAAGAGGMRVVPGIEITSVEDGRDVHILGYFFDPHHDGLSAFLVKQRELRVARVREIVARLAAANVFIDAEQLVTAAAVRPGSSVGRPQIARELVRAGHVASVQDAFDLWLASGRPAFVPRRGERAATVVRIIHDAGGVASFAHPGVTKRDDLIEMLAANSGLDAVEVYHSDHAPEQVSSYRRLAARLGTLVTGGSDFHGEEVRPEPPVSAAEGRRAHRAVFGKVVVPPADFERFQQKAIARRAPHGRADG
ncbi:MAG TPA: PHP domain-containing protein [Vicinamibacterales bacterium]|nr:PHP domain-containing protein [Vicinamibacterales bacterium]